MFYLGQKVVCINDTPQSPFRPCLDGLTKGNVYTIRWIGDYFDIYDQTTNLCIRVEEILRLLDNRYIQDMPYLASRFRPLIEKKTDISVFEKLLIPTKTRELENV